MKIITMEPLKYGIDYNQIFTMDHISALKNQSEVDFRKINLINPILS